MELFGHNVGGGTEVKESALTRYIALQVVAFTVSVTDTGNLIG